MRCLGLTEWGGGGALFVVVFDVISEYLQQFSRLLRALRTVVGLFSFFLSFFFFRFGFTKKYRRFPLFLISL